QALSLLRAGNPEAAASACEDGLRRYPADANLLCLSARANLALRRFDQSRKHAEEAIRRFPDFAAAHDVYGDLLLAQGRAGMAVKAYEQALRLEPARPATLEKIDRARGSLERSSVRAAGEAGRPGRRRMAFQEDILKAQAFMKDGEANKAEDIYRAVLKKDPDHVEAARLLAGIAVANERPKEAEVFLRRVVELAPDYTRAWVDLVNVLRDSGQHEEAIAAAGRVRELSPDTAESWMVYASAIGVAGRHEEAIEAYRNALAIAPDRAGAMCSMAHHLKTIGRSGDAVAQYRAAIAQKPDHSEAYWSLANLKTFRFEDSEVTAMHALMESEELPDESRVQLHNALGFAYEARGDYERAFHHFEQCNLIRRKSESYDPVDTESTHDRVIELFDEEFVSRPGAAESAVTPIFIVGMPRSGSTLIEQILASHSAVDGTHELGDLQNAVQAERRRSRSKDRFPEALAKCTAADWQRIGEDYLARTERHRRGAPYFIDKNPNNFIFTGLLKLAIPNARIITACRHPLDSCLGTFKQLFASGQPFSYDMTELGEYYLQYRRLMEHWHEVLPGFVLDVHYEEVVADFEAQLRRLLDFCGLPFEESCLRFHETERAVKTASSEQVRRPIYTSSLHRWRNYEPWLGELVHILEPVLRTLPGEARPAERFHSQ
ncbi:MAG: tetratricopeptide repeat-containing sulfotransferase family protein, partial [Woeseiaceae bacterium]